LSIVPINLDKAKFRPIDCFESRTGQKLKLEPNNDADDDDYNGIIRH